MAPWKRPPPHSVDQDRDSEAPGNRSKRRQGDSVPTQIGATRDVDLIKEDKWVEKILGTMMRRVVGEEVTSVLGRHLHLWQRPRVQMCWGQTQKTLQLRFKESPGETFTGFKVEAKNGASLEVALYQCDAAGAEGRVVAEGPLSSTRIELCVLQGSFGSDGREDWSSEEFRGSILNQTRKRGKLLTGDLFLRLTNGVGTVKNLYVHDISTWAESHRFRLGARVAEPAPETENIREGISQPFRVKDGRGRGYQKHDTPTLNDEIWRLPCVIRGGKIHELLQSKEINTVEAFLHGLDTESNQLKQELGKLGVGEKKWKKLTASANKARPKQVSMQQYLATAPLDSELQHSVQGMAQPELVAVASQGLSMPSTSTWHFGEAVHSVGDIDDDFNMLAEFLGTSSAHEGDGSRHQPSCPNSGVYISSRGGCITIWSQIRRAFKVTWTWLRLSRAKRKLKLVPNNC